MSRIFFFLFLLFSIVPFSNAQTWETFSFTDAEGVYCASSELNRPNDFSMGKYSPSHLLDHNLATAWVEGEQGNGIGVYVCLAMGDKIKKYIAIANGYQKTHDLFLKNNRIKEMKMTLYIAFTDNLRESQAGFEADAVAYPETFNIKPEDKGGFQYIPNPFYTKKTKAYRDTMLKKYILSHKNLLMEHKHYNSLKDFYFIKFEITGVYPGSKWDDTCLSELTFQNSNTPEYIPYNEKILDIEEDESSKSINVKTSGGNYNLVSTDQKEVAFSLLDEPPDHEWALIGIMTNSPVHVEEINKVYSVRLLQSIPDSLIDSWNIGPPLGFSEKDGQTRIDFGNGEMFAPDVLEEMQHRLHSFSFHEDKIQAGTLLFPNTNQ